MTTTTSTIRTRRRIGPWPIVALVVGVFACAAAVGFFVSTSSDRDDATAERRHAQRTVQQARTDLADAQHDLAAAKTVGQHVVQPVQPITTSVQSLLDLSGQELNEAHTTQSLGAADDPSIDDYNASVDRANAIVDQYNTTLDTVRKQVADLVAGADAQIA
jgi:hypothetical protein